MSVANKNATTPHLDRGDERVRHAAGIRGALRPFLDRLRSGELGELGGLPVVVGLVIICTVFRA